MIADGPDEVTVRVREQLMQGASQIKLTAGGGVSSPHSPLDVSTFTEAELRAAVEAAANWGTYVTVHAYTSAAVQRAIAAGVQCIEHAHLMDDATARMMAEKGVWLSMQPLPDELAEGFPPGSEQRAKAVEVFAGTARTYELAKKYGIKTAWGTDVLFSPALALQQGALLAKIATWFTPAEALAQATGTNAQLLALSGKRNPYPGKLGVVEEGALADLLLVDGNPLENIALVADPARNFSGDHEGRQDLQEHLAVTPQPGRILAPIVGRRIQGALRTSRMAPHARCAGRFEAPAGVPDRRGPHGRGPRPGRHRDRFRTALVLALFLPQGLARRPCVTSATTTTTESERPPASQFNYALGNAGNRCPEQWDGPLPTPTASSARLEM